VLATVHITLPVLRAAARSWIAAAHADDPAAFVVDELGLREGIVRADLAVLGRDFSGYELKSDADTVDRLPAQVAAYGAVFDRAWLVVGPRLCAAATALVPQWWGVLRADGPELHVQRAAAANPAVDAAARAALLWRDEALAAARAHGVGAGAARLRRSVLWDRLAAQLGIEGIAAEVVRAIDARRAWRPQAIPRVRDLTLD
jgi:hypothetical protein